MRDAAIMVNTEDLLIGDESGHVYFYSIEWPGQTERALFDWHGSMTLLARISVHSQQICGIAWSPNGELFASGGNDNSCYMFETKKVLQSQQMPDQEGGVSIDTDRHRETGSTTIRGHGSVLSISPGREKHKWTLNAAVKAIAFCPWQRGLIAIGGGSNDRCIHFFHTTSGACLATIDCAAQITSLIWSTKRREICATFGFAQPDHPFRIAVFSWPTCEQIVAIPWYDESRALYAISYPGGPNTGNSREEARAWGSRTKEEGCIVVAASDAAIRFHEVWDESKKKSVSTGLLGGSEILESLHGIEKESAETIR
jgi:WD40 repeat protein